jgi:hypothetical protein
MMDAQEAQAAYRTTKSQLDTGQITLEEYNRRISELRYQDNTDTWWAVSPQDGSWLRWTGSEWVVAFAPQAAVTQPVQQLMVKQTVAGAQPAAAVPIKPACNWAGIGSLILGIISWIFYPYILGILAIILGGYSLYSIRKTTDKLAFIAIAGIIIALASMVVDYSNIGMVSPFNLSQLK